jgi:methylthioribose-1-phosphate isomerase
MDENKPTGNLARGPVPFAGESTIDYRARIAAHQIEIEERRQLELLEQRSSMNTPSVRIRIWERLHQVDLPRSPAHRLIAVIAAQTGLTAGDVLDEQRLRAMPPALPPALPPAA